MARNDVKYEQVYELNKAGYVVTLWRARVYKVEPQADGSEVKVLVASSRKHKDKLWVEAWANRNGYTPYQ